MLVGPVTSSSQETWQQRVILASQSYILSEDDSPGDSGHSDDDFVELFGSLIDNSSHQCPSVCIPCPDDQPLWYLVLRWLKMLLLKIARSYHAKPLILVIAPLVVGISVGYWLGARKEPASKNSMNYQSSTGRLFTSLCWKLRDLIALVCFRTGAWWALGSEDSSVTPNISEYKLESCTAEKCPVATSGKSKKFVEKEDRVRENLKSEVGTLRESGVHVTQVPRHVAVIMDGNRRYGKAKYGNISKGHWDGSSKLVEFAKWCIAEQVSVLTVYAFSTENWNRDPAEVTALMAIFSKYCDELRVEALKRNIRIMVLSTDTRRIPAHVKDGLSRMTADTKHCTGLIMNICLSYGSRGEILNATRSLAAEAASGRLAPDAIDEAEFQKHLLTGHCGDPDVLIRTSGEVRISNYLLWQLAYSEMFFLEKPWPAVEKEDLLEVIRTYAEGRIRRFGK